MPCARIFVTLDSLSTFRVWQVATDNEAGKAPSIFMTREIGISGLTFSCNSFQLISGFCYFSTGSMIMVAEPEEFFRTEQIENMAMYFAKSGNKKSSRLAIAAAGGVQQVVEEEKRLFAKAGSVIAAIPNATMRKSLSKMAGDPFVLIDRVVLRLRRALHSSPLVILYELSIDKAALAVYTINITYNAKNRSDDKLYFGEIAKWAVMLNVKMKWIFLSTIWDRKGANERAMLYVLGREIFGAASLAEAQDPVNQPFDMNLVIPQPGPNAESKDSVCQLDESLKVLAVRFSLSVPSALDAKGRYKVTMTEQNMLRVLSNSRWPLAPDGQLPNSTIRTSYRPISASPGRRTKRDVPKEVLPVVDEDKEDGFFDVCFTERKNSRASSKFRHRSPTISQSYWDDKKEVKKEATPPIKIRLPENFRLCKPTKTEYKKTCLLMSCQSHGGHNETTNDFMSAGYHADDDLDPITKKSDDDLRRDSTVTVTTLKTSTNNRRLSVMSLNSKATAVSSKLSSSLDKSGVVPSSAAAYNAKVHSLVSRWASNNGDNSSDSLHYNPRPYSALGSSRANTFYDDEFRTGRNESVRRRCNTAPSSDRSLITSPEFAFGKQPKPSRASELLRKYILKRREKSARKSADLAMPKVNLDFGQFDELDPIDEKEEPSIDCGSKWRPKSALFVGNPYLALYRSSSPRQHDGSSRRNAASPKKNEVGWVSFVSPPQPSAHSTEAEYRNWQC